MSHRTSRRTFVGVAAGACVSLTGRWAAFSAASPIRPAPTIAARRARRPQSPIRAASPTPTTKTRGSSQFVSRTIPSPPLLSTAKKMSDPVRHCRVGAAGPGPFVNKWTCPLSCPLVLSSVLARLEVPASESVLLGLDTPDDAAVIKPTNGPPPLGHGRFFSGLPRRPLPGRSCCGAERDVRRLRSGRPADRRPGHGNYSNRGGEATGATSLRAALRRLARIPTGRGNARRRAHD